MAPVSLPCVMGTDTCNFKTTELDYEHANKQLESHMRFAHGNQGGTQHNDKNKPEKFPRPSIETDSTTEVWEDFEATWKQYKEEYNLSGRGLIRQLHACCSTDLKTSLSRLMCGKQFEQTEDNLLKLMKQLAVRHQNPAVHVQEFLGLTQQADEGVDTTSHVYVVWQEGVISMSAVRLATIPYHTRTMSLGSS